jgi:hypothetical protein
MGNPPLRPDFNATISTLLRRFLAYTRARSTEERARLEREILALFDLLGAADDRAVLEVRAEFDALRAEGSVDSYRIRKVADDARDFATYRIRIFENVPGNPSLTGPARNMLRIPLSEAADRSGHFNEEQAEISISRILDSIRKVPSSEIEGDKKRRTSIAVIRAFAENFCNIPPFCSGKPV